MSLKCKAGSYATVFDELLKMDIPPGDIFLLFGPMDIFCKFEFKTLYEFKSKWFNPIRTIGGQEVLIIRTMTFIVIESGGETPEEPYAIIFLNTQPRDLESVQETLIGMRNVLTADTVFGPYEVVCLIRARNRNELKKVLSDIQKIPGVEGSATSIVAGMRI